MDLLRRLILLAGGGTLLGCTMPERSGAAARAGGETFEVQLSEADWRKRLTPAQFSILREDGTERPYTSPLNAEKREGRYACAGCQLELYSSKTKYESRTGWPSFYQPLENAVREHKDSSWGMVRTEVHCRRCGGHLGHVFNDGPQPTGMRYCMNGLALAFEPGPA